MNHNIIGVSKEACMVMVKILELEPICSSCSDKINENNFGGIVGNKIFCNSLPCLFEFADETEGE